MTAPTPITPAPAGAGFATNVCAVARRELREAIGSRWFVLDTIAFSVLAVAIASVSLAGTGAAGFAGFARTAAGLLNLVMLVVPLMAIAAGAGSIAAERERGTLLYLLAQPVSRAEVVLGKFVGLALALSAVLLLGFGLSAAALAMLAGTTGVVAFLWLVGLSCGLALAMLAVGMLVSVLSRKASVAVGVAVFVWLVLVFASDLGLMAGTLVFKLRVEQLFALAVASPLQAFKMGVVLHMNDTLDVLGPAGAYATQSYGRTLQWLLPAVIAAWGALALAAATALFSWRSPA